MSWVADVLSGLGVTGREHVAFPEGAAFPDGAAFRIEIPSVEGPRVLEAVLRAAESEGITVNRVSQGSGAVLLRAVELRDMAQAGLETGIEVCLFVGPRERYGVGAHARSEDGRAHGDQIRGLRQISYALEDVLRATEAGIRSFLVADLGLLRALTEAQAQGSLPAGLVWKISAAMSPSNPVIILILAIWGLQTELTSHAPGIMAPSWSWFTTSHSPGGSTGLIAGVVIATFLLGGWDSPIYLGDEQQRQRDPGRSVLISITFCTLWVVFLFVCLQGLAPASEITNNASNVLPFLAGRLGPKAFADLVALAVIASFATTIQSQIVDGSRIMFGMGRDRTVPSALGRVNHRFRTPVAGLIVMGVIPILALVLYLASSSLEKTIIYIDSTGGLLFAGYYVVISAYSIYYHRTVLFRDAREFFLGLLLPLIGAGTLVYVIVKSLPGTPVPVRIIALVLFLVGIPLAFLSKAITRAPFFATRREHYREGDERPEPAHV